ncbi:MAG: hypothetical protein K0S54_2969 [Alphaproteobacteria bacterium]|nr:hypothetical protein [Alphaproteobacteria bacterium]
MSQDSAGYKAVAKLYNALMTGVVLTLVSQRGNDPARQFVQAHFRRQHLEKFLPGVKKLGLDRLPDAVACAQYHYLSNALGGVKTEYVRESDAKAWVRYPPPRWIWQGTAICGVPTEVNAAMLYGWHGHNGVSLGNPRLGFVCTGLTTDGDPGLEGYYFDHGHPIAEHERVRYARDERMPRFDPAQAPRLDVASWPDERLAKVERAYAVEYLRSLVPTLTELFGEQEMAAIFGRTARLIGMQFYDDIASLLGVAEKTPQAFVDLVAALLRGSGENVEAGRNELRQSGWKVMAGIDAPVAALAAWNELIVGMLSVHDRFATLALEDRRARDGSVVWRIS